MKVFISWSGEQTLALGHELKAFLDTAFAGHVHTFLSDADIAPGERFLGVINNVLEESTLGILLLTRANMASPWILFEAGALAGKTSSGSVVPLLVDLERAELKPPLSQFNNVYGGVESDIRKLCSRVNLELGNRLNSDAFELLFAQAWPKLRAAIQVARDRSSAPAPLPSSRTPEDKLDEILLGVNALVRNSTAPPEKTLVTVGRPSGRNDDFALYPGDAVTHADFGEGSVLAVKGDGAKQIATVDFGGVSPKKLLVKIAPIAVVRRASEGPSPEGEM